MLCVHTPDVVTITSDWSHKTNETHQNSCGSSAAAHLEMDVDVVSEDVHSEELAGADLAGVLLIAVGQQMFVHVTSAGEHLCTHTERWCGHVWTLLRSPRPESTHLVADGAGRRFLPVLGPLVSIRLEILFLHVLRS